MGSLVRTLLLLGVLAAAVGAVVLRHQSTPGWPEGVPPTLDAELVPAAGSADPSPRRVTLPHDWRHDATFERARYVLSVPIDSEPTVAWSLYLPRTSPLRSLRVAGRVLPIDEDLAPLALDLAYRPLPLLVPIPIDLLGPGQVDIEFEIEAAPGLGYVGPAFLGPDSVLRPAFAARTLSMVLIWRVIVFELLLFSVMLVSAWVLRREDGVALWLGLFFFFAAAGMWNLATFDLPLPHPEVTYVGNGWMLAIFVVLVHRLHDVHRPRVELGFAAVGLFAMATRIFVPEGPAQGVLRPILFGSMILAAAYPLGLVVREQWRGERPEQDFVTAAIFAFAAGGAHDLLVQGGFLSRSHDPIVVDALGVSALLFAWIFARRYIGALSTTERLAETLEARVALRETQLEDNYQHLAEIEGERALERERTRVIEELHDGTGGQIASALASLSNPSVARDTVASGLRTALEDMRLVLHSLDRETGDLGSLLGMLRDQLERALGAAGIELVWDVRDVPAPDRLGSEDRLDLARIVQAAVANVVEHAEARVVAVRTRRDSSGATVVSIEDDGIGFDPAAASEPSEGRGRGRVHMRRRAERLGATLRIERRDPGTSVELVIDPEPTSAGD